MIYRVKEGQVSYGEAIGIILVENYAPYIPGDVANATTYNFPVRFQRVKSLKIDKLFKRSAELTDDILKAGKSLVNEGVKAITSDCGFLIFYQDTLANELSVPVFMSSLLQLKFIINLIGMDDKIGIITSNSEALRKYVINDFFNVAKDKIVIRGMENKEHFVSIFYEEKGELDTTKFEEEVVSVAKEMVSNNPEVKIILCECSAMAPYGPAIQNAVELPVFDYITMINYVHSATIKQRFNGFM